VAYSAAMRESLSNFEVAHILEDEDEDNNLVQTLQFFQRINCFWALCANFRHQWKP